MVSTYNEIWKLAAKLWHTANEIVTAIDYCYSYYV